MKYLKIILILLSVLIVQFMSGCKNKLTREKAEEMIIKRYQVPHFESKEMTILDATFGQNQTKAIFEKLNSEGLLTYSEGNGGWIGSVVGKMTEKGKQYVLSDEHSTENQYIKEILVKTANLDFGEITGIIENKDNNTVEVEFTIRRKDITPFGRIVFDINEEVINQKCIFTKYDDGWRIVK